MADDNKTVFKPKVPADNLATDEAFVDPIGIPGVRITRQLGEGGMAVVYEGLDEGFSPPRRVAVKLMGPDLSADAEFRARFDQEASLVADFRHDNVVHVYSSGEVAGEKYLVMEYLPGGTLAERLEQGSLPLQEAVNVARAMADALAYSHARGIVHRDFKPGNVLFTDEGKPVLSDFGVAKVVTKADAALTRNASVIGAARYMAPEQELGEPVTDRADVYSWGLTLYEMLEGHPPPNALRQARSAEHEAELAGHLLGSPAPLVGLLSACLASDPRDRPSAKECMDIARALANGDTGTDYSAVRSASARKSNAGPIALVGLAVGVAAVAWFLFDNLWRGKPAEPPPDLRVDESVGPVAPPEQGPADHPQSVAIDVPIELRPEFARLYVDGSPVSGPAVALDPGVYQLVAVAEGHAGVVSSLTVEAGGSPAIGIELEPNLLPMQEELDQFFALSDAATVTESDIGGIGNPTLRAALDTKLLSDAGQSQSLAGLMVSLRTLQRFGDQGAPSALFLADSIRAGRIEQDRISAELRSAADDGDLFASFLIALALRDTLRQSELSASSPEFRAYCDRLSRIVEQGWSEVAGPLRQRDGCLFDQP